MPVANSTGLLYVGKAEKGFLDCRYLTEGTSGKAAVTHFFQW